MPKRKVCSISPGYLDRSVISKLVPIFPLSEINKEMILYEGIFGFPSNGVWETTLNDTTVLLLGRVANQWMNRYILAGQVAPSTKMISKFAAARERAFWLCVSPRPDSPSVVCGSLLIQLISF